MNSKLSKALSSQLRSDLQLRQTKQFGRKSDQHTADKVWGFVRQHVHDKGSKKWVRFFNYCYVNKLQKGFDTAKKRHWKTHKFSSGSAILLEQTKTRCERWICPLWRVNIPLESHDLAPYKAQLSGSDHGRYAVSNDTSVQKYGCKRRQMSVNPKKRFWLIDMKHECYEESITRGLNHSERKEPEPWSGTDLDLTAPWVRHIYGPSDSKMTSAVKLTDGTGVQMSTMQR